MKKGEEKKKEFKFCPIWTCSNCFARILHLPVVAIIVWHSHRLFNFIVICFGFQLSKSVTYVSFFFKKKSASWALMTRRTEEEEGRSPWSFRKRKKKPIRRKRCQEKNAKGETKLQNAKKISIIHIRWCSSIGRCHKTYMLRLWFASGVGKVVYLKLDVDDQVTK